jgi:hypothetical protein
MISAESLGMTQEEFEATLIKRVLNRALINEIDGVEVDRTTFRRVFSGEAVDKFLTGTLALD